MIKKTMFAFCMAGMIACSVVGCARETSGELSEEELKIKESAENRLEAVQMLNKIIIGISPDYAPFAFETLENEDGLSFAGADITLGNYIAEQLEVEAEFCVMEFEECLEAVENGSVDLVLLGMLPKEERESSMDFTDIYYKPGKQILLVRKAQKDKYKDLNDFEGKTVAAQYGTLQAQLVVEQLPDSYMELTDNVSEAVLMLRTGSADAVALEEVIAEENIEENSDLAISTAELLYAQEGIVGGVVKGETELLDAVNEIISKVKEEHLYFKWLEEATEQAKAVSLATP